ncbi:MAG: hypothetical protein F4Y02_15515 [Chloroflexi bacterium]|nr:hypothetical protein [Chloroflexota bacterium]
MRRDELEHIIRAAADVTGEKEFIVIGSQAILGQYPDAPAPLLMSMEADLYARYAPDKSDFIDGSLGRDSRFDQTFGYHADGVSPSTAKLPSGWEDRLTLIRNPNTRGAGGWCIEAHDIAIAKYFAGRAKDLRYNADLWKAGYLDPVTIEDRLAATELDDDQRERMTAAIRRHRTTHHAPARAAAAATGPT